MLTEGGERVLYTHPNGLLDAVAIKKTDTYTPSHFSTSHHHHEDEDEENELERSAEKAQIKSFSTRSVEKISDLVSKLPYALHVCHTKRLDSMNISAALSINTNMIGGSANGSYIDSDKFKQSDINYFVQVRVTNQRVDGSPYSRLNLVNSVRNNPLDPHTEDDEDS